MKSKKLPKFLKGYFWFTNFDRLDLDKDKEDIIHQILSIGSLEAVRWLFNTYGRNTIRKVFLEKPAKTYRPETFNWAKNILLDLEKKKLNLNQYVINTSRYIRR
jgi:CRISPR/Cas system CSM-associated protein Csm2 small subunit